MCNVEATDQGSLEDHFAGKKHIKNLKSHVEKVHESKKPDTWIRGNGKFRCEICNVETSDQGQLDRHLAGKKHFKKSVTDKAKESDKKVNENMLDLNKQHKKKLEILSKATNGNFRCEICNINTTAQGQLDIHLVGKKHFKKAVQEAAQKRIDSIENVCGKGQLISE